MMKKLKSYSELLKLSTFNERLEYLYLGDKVGHITFGPHRYLNQKFYLSDQWRKTRDSIIIRDNGCDLGIEGCDLRNHNILIHHINPITIEDVIHMRSCLFDPDNLISVSKTSHNYIHYGDNSQSKIIWEARSPNDTCPWKRR